MEPRGKMDAKLLQKIEELNLYVLQLEKENKRQDELIQYPVVKKITVIIVMVFQGTLPTPKVAILELCSSFLEADFRILSITLSVWGTQ